MNQANNQVGVGLVEVMVAVLLLAVAVLGFSALQLRAVKATDESLVRTQAMSIVRGLSESMRDNTEQLATYQTVINGSSTTASKTCSNFEDANKCTPAEIATKEAIIAKNAAMASGVKLGIADCPNTDGFAEVKCVIAAWNDTNAAFGSEDNDCATTSGMYNTKASCVIVEAY
ncbi:type IV pilus modification protein PilV [Psychrobacter pygoscelis]|uniref:type IV pilus modification protein PilV n=1 Tax=Psychrobacter pygoscelis TaxID=2488563 RepID=UPI00103C865D|nr:type IV pilus modification protein PilV [Psychrobacter pygoscelis]